MTVIVTDDNHDDDEAAAAAAEAAAVAAEAAADAAGDAADAAEAAADAAAEPPPPPATPSPAGEMVHSLEMAERIREIAREEADLAVREHCDGEPHLSQGQVQDHARTAAHDVLGELIESTIPDSDVIPDDAGLTIVTPDVSEELLEERRPTWKRIWA